MSEAQTATVTFRLGQPVPWPAAPDRIAQVAELRRTRVRVCYRTKTGRWRHPIVAAGELQRICDAERDAFLPIQNPLGRGVLPRSKTFDC